ncbi:MAG TPA: SPASM domain-containing protein, partial [Patescibacteria group bacterium]|nr:SPASM domain-containing protein [Patescibacteria group bacterium]
IPLIFPGADISMITPASCHAYNGTGMVVTNQGLLSYCERTLNIDDPLAEHFIWGRVVNGKIQTNNKIINKVENIPLCSNCFMRWHCQGQCHYDRLAEKGDPLGGHAHGCQIVRLIGWHLLNKNKR